MQYHQQQEKILKDYRYKNKAMIIMAAKSSKIAMATRHNRSESGMRFPSSANIPSAKAISVAAGIAHPLMAIGSCQLR